MRRDIVHQNPTLSGAGGSNGGSGSSGSYDGRTSPGGAGRGPAIHRALVTLGITAGRGGESSCGDWNCYGSGGGGVLVLARGPDRNSSRAAQGWGAGGGPDIVEGASGVVIVWRSGI